MATTVSTNWGDYNGTTQIVPWKDSVSSFSLDQVTTVNTGAGSTTTQTAKTFEFGRTSTGSAELQGAMLASGHIMEGRQKEMANLLKDGITATEVADLNRLGNDVSMMSSFQKALNTAAKAGSQAIG